MLFDSGLINDLITFLSRYNTIYVSLWHVLALCDILETINNSFWWLVAGIGSIKGAVCIEQIQDR